MRSKKSDLCAAPVVVVRGCGCGASRAARHAAAGALHGAVGAGAQRLGLVSGSACYNVQNLFFKHTFSTGWTVDRQTDSQSVNSQLKKVKVIVFEADNKTTNMDYELYHN